jgi:phage tail sheath gpL-like
MATESIESEAARFNRIVMRKLQKAIEADPEVDLASKLPTGYSLRLAGRKKGKQGTDF